MRLRLLLSLLVSSLALLSPVWVSAKGKAQDDPLHSYSITGADRPAAQGAYMVKVSVNTSNANLSDRELAKCAVHGVIFHGFSSGGMHAEKPLASSESAEAANAEFFNDFFANHAAGYGNPIVGSRQVTKVNKKEYVVSCIVEVQKDRLKKALRDAGVIKGLNTGF